MERLPIGLVPRLQSRYVDRTLGFGVWLAVCKFDEMATDLLVDSLHGPRAFEASDGALGPRFGYNSRYKCVWWPLR